MSDDNNLPKPIAIVTGIITSIIAFITAIVGFILLWQGNTQIVSTVVIAVGVIGLWGSFFYIRFSKKKGDIQKRSLPAGQRKRKGKLAFAFPQRQRDRALIGIYAIPVIATLGLGIYIYEANQSSRPEKGVVIAIADFDGPEPQKYGVTQFIMGKIDENIKDFNFVELIKLNQSITATMGSSAAIDIGKKNGANLVLWGWFVASENGVNVTYHIEDINSYSGLGISLEFTSTENMTAPKMQTETFDFQSKQLPDNVVNDLFSGISLVLAGKGEFENAIRVENTIISHLSGNSSSFSDYNKLYADALASRAQYEASISDFDQSSIDINKAISMEPCFTTYFVRGNIYLMKGDFTSAIADFKSSTDYPPDSDRQAFTPYFSIGQIYYKQGEYDNSINILSQGLDKIKNCSPDYGCHLLLYRRGLAYIKVGNKAAALSDFEKIKEITNNPETHRIIDALLENMK